MGIREFYALFEAIAADPGARDNQPQYLSDLDKIISALNASPSSSSDSSVLLLNRPINGKSPFQTAADAQLISVCHRLLENFSNEALGISQNDRNRFSSVVATTTQPIEIDLPPVGEIKVELPSYIFPLPNFLDPDNYLPDPNLSLDDYNTLGEAYTNQCLDNILQVLSINRERHQEIIDELKYHIENYIAFKKAEHRNIMLAVNPNTVNETTGQTIVTEDNIRKQLNETVNKLINIQYNYTNEHFGVIARDNTFVADDIQLFSVSLPILTKDQRERLQAEYAVLASNEIIQRNAFNIDPSTLPNTKYSIGDISIQKNHEEIKLNIARIRFTENLVMACADSNKYTESLKTQIINDLSSFLNGLRLRSNIKIGLSDRVLNDRCKDFSETYAPRFNQIKILSAKIAIREKELELISQQIELPALSEAIRPNLERRIAAIQTEIQQYKDKLKDHEKAVSNGTTLFFKNLIDLPNQKAFSDTFKAFNFSEQEIIEHPGLTKEASTQSMARGFFQMLLGAERISQIEAAMGMTQTGARYAAISLGGLMTLGPLGAVAAPVAAYTAVQLAERATQLAGTASELVETARNTLYGEFTQKYSPDSFDVNNNLNDAFGPVKADIVNSFYANILFNIDTTLAAMSDVKRREPSSLILLEILTQLSGHYEDLKAGRYSPAEAIEIYRNDVKTILQQEYFKDQESVSQLILKIRESDETAKLPPPSQSSNQERRLTLVGAPSSSISSHQYALVQQTNVINSLHSNVEGRYSILQLYQRMGQIFNSNNVEYLQYNDPDTYEALTLNPTKQTLEDYTRKLIDENIDGPLLFWFRETLFSVGNRNTIDRNRHLASSPFSNLNNKTLWHILSERSDGLVIFEKIIAAQQSATAIRPWSFSDYFDINILYNGANPVAYALLNKNLPLGRAFLANLARSNYSPDEAKTCFRNILDTLCNDDIQNRHKAKLFCDSLGREIADTRPITLSSVATSISNLASFSSQHDSSYVEIMCAISIYLAQGNQIPNTVDEIEHLLKTLQRSRSALFHVADIPEDLHAVAIKLHKYLNGHSAILNYLNTLSDQNTLTYQLGYRLFQADLGTDEQAIVTAILKNDIKLLVDTLNQNTSFAKKQFNLNGFGRINLLYLAAKLGHPEIAAELYKRGAYAKACGPDIGDPSKNVNALLIAAQEGQSDVIAAILKARSEVNIAGYRRSELDSLGRTAFHYLAESGSDVCLPWVQSETHTHIPVLYNFPAFCNIADLKGNTPLHLLASSNRLDLIESIDNWMRSQKYANGISDIFNNEKMNALTFKNNEGITPIEIAILKDNPRIVSFLLTLMIKTNSIYSITKDIGLTIKNNPNIINYDYLFSARLEYDKSLAKENNFKNYPEYIKSLNAYLQIGIFAESQSLVENSLDSMLELHAQSKEWYTGKTAIRSSVLNAFEFALIHADSSSTALIADKLRHYAENEYSDPSKRRDDPNLLALIKRLSLKSESDPELRTKLDIAINTLVELGLVYTHTLTQKMIDVDSPPLTTSSDVNELGETSEAGEATSPPRERQNPVLFSDLSPSSSGSNPSSPEPVREGSPKKSRP